MAAQIKTCFERYEKKYRLTAEQQRAILQGMAPYMKKDAYGAYTICNIYYDTPDWRLIRTSLEKPVYKEKLRVRSYGVPGGAKLPGGADAEIIQCGGVAPIPGQCPRNSLHSFGTGFCGGGIIEIDHVFLTFQRRSVQKFLR